MKVTRLQRFKHGVGTPQSLSRFFLFADVFEKGRSEFAIRGELKFVATAQNIGIMCMYYYNRY